jgi:hypothetical protein
MGKRKYPPLLARFESRYIPEPNSGCWPWRVLSLDAIAASGIYLQQFSCSFFFVVKFVRSPVSFGEQTMPTLKNSRHERMAQFLASGKTATDAYELAGYRRSNSNGAARARTEEIRTRVAEINTESLERERATAAAAAERAVITRQRLVEMALEARKGALEAKQYSAAVAATKEIGILSGIRIERSERGMPGEFDELERMSADELRAFVGKTLAQAAIGEPSPSDSCH